MHVFLTGGTGFIGSHVLEALVAQGHAVTALCREPQPARAPDSPLVRWLRKPMDELLPDDFAGCEVLMHLASPGTPPRKADGATLFHWNVSVLVALLQTARAAGVRRMVLAGSYAEYGESCARYPFIPNDAPLLPTYAYAASKAAGFCAAHAFAVEQRVELCYLRIFSAFGEGQYAENFWPALQRAALSGQDFPMTPGAQVRDYLHVSRVAQAFLLAGQDGSVLAGRPWVRNVGSGQPVTMLDFATHWWSAWNGRGRLLPGALAYRPNELMRCVPAQGPGLLAV